MRKQPMKMILSSLLLLPAVVIAQDSAGSNVADTAAEPQQSAGATRSGRAPYEIVITPTVTRTDLRTMIQTVEDDFFARFNELNIDENYDIVGLCL